MIDLQRDFVDQRTELMTAVERVLGSGRYILGEEVEAFENAVAERLGVGGAVGVASGTDALRLALQAAGVQGKKVITTPFTFFATATAAIGAGADPVLVDIDPRTFNIDAAGVRSLLAGNSAVHTRLKVDPNDIAAILPVHLYGAPAAMDEIVQTAAEYGIEVIEDAAQAMGAVYKDRKVGALGSAACFSFFPTKNLAGFGDGGLVTTSDERLEERVRVLRAHGAVKKYHHDHIGLNSRLDSIQAALLMVRLSRLDDTIAARRAHADAYNRALADVPEIELPQSDSDVVHTYHQYTIRVGNGHRDELATFLKERGVDTAIYYPVPLHLQPALSHLGYKVGDFPAAELAASEVLSLPIFPSMSHDERSHVIQTVTEFFSLRRP